MSRLAYIRIGTYALLLLSAFLLFQQRRLVIPLLLGPDPSTVFHVPYQAASWRETWIGGVSDYSRARLSIQEVIGLAVKEAEYQNWRWYGENELKVHGINLGASEDGSLTWRVDFRDTKGNLHSIFIDDRGLAVRIGEPRPLWEKKDNEPKAAQPGATDNLDGA